MFVVGVDGCRDGWVAVALQDGAFAGAAPFGSFSELARACDGAAVVAVDIPIGLLENSERACDRVARDYIGARAAAVFATAPRPALMLASYEDANAECRRRAGFGLTRQAWALRDKILEVDAFVRDKTVGDGDRPPPSSRGSVASSKGAGPDASPAKAKGWFVQHGRRDADPQALRRFARIITPERKSSLPPALLPAGRLIEVHPEASFRELSGAPLPDRSARHSKKSSDGAMARIDLLAKAGIAVPPRLEVGRVLVDDVLDAAAAAWSANRYLMGTAKSLPPREQWQYDAERVIAIWV